MSKRRFTKEQIEELLKNDNVTRCSDKSISYSKKFKQLAIKQYNEGWSSNQIFREGGFDLELIGVDIPKGCLGRWRQTYQLKGVTSFDKETRGGRGGRPKTKWKSETERIKYLEIENAYLKAENDFLAKLRASKKR